MLAKDKAAKSDRFKSFMNPSPTSFTAAFPTANKREVSVNVYSAWRRLACSKKEAPHIPRSLAKPLTPAGHEARTLGPRRTLGLGSALSGTGMAERVAVAGERPGGPMPLSSSVPDLPRVRSSERLRAPD